VRKATLTINLTPRSERPACASRPSKAELRQALADLPGRA
jgi:hypothetical protein